MCCAYSVRRRQQGCMFPERLSVRKQKFKFSEYQPFLSAAPGGRCRAEGGV